VRKGRERKKKAEKGMKRANSASPSPLSALPPQRRYSDKLALRCNARISERVETATKERRGKEGKKGRKSRGYAE
jgi:predicted HicB family RNase H-like nuclease